MNTSNFVIDRVLRGMMLHSSTGEVLWSINQIESPNLTVSVDSTDAVDALGTPIMSFDRAKQAEFSAENAIFDLGLFAAQAGTAPVTSSATTKVLTPCFQEIDVTAEKTATLKHEPAEEAAAGIPYIYVLNGDGSLGKKYAYAAAASETEFTYTDTTMTLPTDKTLTAGMKVLVIYEYEADDNSGAVSVVNTAKNFPTAGKFVMEVLVCDVCDPSTLYYAYLIFPQAKLSAEIDMTFDTESKHSFSMKAMQQYCDHEKKLFSLVIPEAEQE